MKIESPKVNFNTIVDLKGLTPVYHQEYDTFYLRGEKPRPATSYDLNGIAWLRVDVENGDIVGLQIDDFESVFLKKYPELEKAWKKEIKSLCVRRKSRKCPVDAQESFLLIIINFLLTLFRENPPQESFTFIPA
jgi:hypothetical protein